MSENPDGRLGLADLIARVAAQDGAALADLYQATSAKLLGVCVRILNEQAESEDVLQEVYITVWRRAGTFDPARGASAMTWLAAIARNRAIDQLRQRRPLAEAVRPDAVMRVADTAPLPDAYVAACQDTRRLHACLEELEVHSAAVIRTAFFEGVAYDTLAHRLDQPVGTVKSWIRRGLQKLRDCLER